MTDAVLSRKSIRQFLPTPVENEAIRSLLEMAARSPSRQNLQPWKIYVVNGDAMATLKAEVDGTDEDETTGYEVEPPQIWQPHRQARFDLVEQMFDKYGIGHEEMDRRVALLDDRNYKFFDAPAALFCFVDRRMGTAQWTDLGMFLQTFMLLAQEAGLDTCAQEYWAKRSNQVSTFVNAPDDLMLVCGMAIGHHDPDAAINSVASERIPIDEFATFL